MLNSYSEKIILLELHREFIDIAKMRKVKFSVANIQLFESLSKWGEFDPLTKTIYLSRKLIENFSWQHVIGVLKHEMAHQWVYENYPYADVAAHGNEFQKACEKLMVPPLYASSKVELVEENTDFKISESNSNPLIDKVKKLMSLATSSNEHEASLAASKVRELYLKYNIEQIGLGVESDLHHLVIATNKKRLSLIEKKVISILVEYYFVKVIVTQQFDAKSLTHYQALEVIGRKENILMAEYVYHFLLRTCDVKSGEGRLETSSLKIGMLDGFVSKLKAEVAPLTKETKALLVVGDAELEDYMHDYFPRLRSLKTSSRRISSNHYDQGVSRGKKINLNKPVSGKNSSTLRLLGIKLTS